MRISWIGWSVIFVTIIGCSLFFFLSGINAGWAVLTTLLVAISLMCAGTISTFLAVSKRNIPEVKVWKILIGGAFTTLIGQIFYILAYVYPSSEMTYSILSLSFFAVAYGCFIAGLWVESTLVESKRPKINIWFLIMFNIIAFSTIGYFL